MRKNIVIIAVIILLQSCARESNIVDANFSLIDSMDLPFDASELILTNTLSAADGKDSLLVLHHQAKNELFICNLSEKIIIDSVNLNQYTDESPNNIEPAIDAKGNLYILECGNLVMKVIDRKAGTQRELPYRGSDSSIGVIIPLLMPLIIFEDSTFYSLKYDLGPHYTRDQLRKFYSRKPLAKFRLTDSTIECVSSFGDYPDKFKTGMYDHFALPLTAINRDSFLYCFNDLNCFLQTSKDGNTHKIAINYEVPPMPPLNFDSVGSLSYSKSLSIRTPSVARLHYKPTSDRLLIFYKPPAEPLSAEGELNTYVDCDNYILSVPLRKNEPILRYLIPKRFEFRASILFQDKLIWKSREEAGKMKLYMVKLNEDAIH